MKAVILAGGYGKRLMPLTENAPKPLMPVLNNPVIDYNIRLLQKAGIDEIFITLQYLPEKVKEFLNGRYGENAFRYIIEDAPLGTAGSVGMLRSELSDGDFLVISADALTDLNIKNFITRHAEGAGTVTMAVTRVDDPTGYGVLNTDEFHFVKEFMEKPAPGEFSGNLINCGIYMCTPRVLDFIPGGGACDFARDIFPKLLEFGEPVNTFLIKSYWRDIGTFRALYEANMDALMRNIDFTAFKGGFEAILEASGSIPHPRTPSAITGRGLATGLTSCVCPRSVIGENVSVDSGAVISGAVIFPGVRVTESAVNCILYDGGKVDLAESVPEDLSQGLTPGKLFDFS